MTYNVSSGTLNPAILIPYFWRCWWTPSNLE